MSLEDTGMIELRTAADIRAAIVHQLRAEDCWLFVFCPTNSPEVSQFRDAMIDLAVPHQGAKTGRFRLQDANTGEVFDFGVLFIPKSNMPVATFAKAAAVVGQTIVVDDTQNGCVVTTDRNAVSLFSGLLDQCWPADKPRSPAPRYRPSIN